MSTIRTRLRSSSTAAVVALALGGSSTANASAASRLVYSRSPGAASCPDERRFRAAVAERLGYDPFFPWAEQTVTVHLCEEKEALRAKIALIDHAGIVRGTRELRGDARDCDELLASLALATSITLDPMAASPEPAPAQPARPSVPAANPTPAAPPLPVATAPMSASPASYDRGPEAKDHTPPAPRPSWSAYGGPVLAVGESPSLGLGGRLGAGFHYGDWAVFGELRGDLPTSAASELGGSVHVGVLGGAIAPCFTTGAWAACGIFYLGSINMRGTDVEIPLERSLLFAAAGARVEATIPIVRALELRLHLDGMKPLMSSSLFLHQREVWTTPPLWVAAGFSAAVRFP